jgi:FecR protein
MPNSYRLARSRSLRWNSLHSFLIGLGLILTLGLVNSPLAAQTAISRGTISEILDGNQVYIQNNTARVRDVASRGQQVRTGSARTQVTFNTGAVARLSNNSVLTIGQCAQLQRGVLLVNGAVNGCTSSVTAGVRGTTYIIKVDESGREEIQVLEGEVVVTKQPEQSNGDASSSTLPALPHIPRFYSWLKHLPPPTDSQPTPPETPDSVTLTAGEAIATRRGERLGAAERISAEDFLAILNGDLFRNFLEQLPGIANIRNSFQQLYPQVPFPLNTPELPEPNVPRPRLPFGF